MGADANKTKENVISGLYSFPPYPEISESAKDLITKILKTDPLERILFEEMEQHPFLTGWKLPSYLPLECMKHEPEQEEIDQII